jgi:hypothetical protein
MRSGVWRLVVAGGLRLFPAAAGTPVSDTIVLWLIVTAIVLLLPLPAAPRHRPPPAK